MPEYPLPAHVVANGRVLPANTDHPALSYYRFVPQGLQDEQKADFLRELAGRYGTPGVWRTVCSVTASRLAATVAAMDKQGREPRIAVRRLASRLLVGMGYKNALEVGLTFHHPGGFPYLPGTSVKGLCRAWATEVEGKEAVEREDPGVIRRIFGSESKNVDETQGDFQTGSVIFLDALPTAFPKLEVDLLNPHYGAYYMDETGETAPSDWLSPKPVPFLAVAIGSAFQFAIVGRDRSDETRADVSKAWGWLMDALTDLGAGGKTAAGYGYFEPYVEPAARRACPDGFVAGRVTRSTPKRDDIDGRILVDGMEQPLRFSTASLTDGTRVHREDEVCLRMEDRAGVMWAVDVHLR